MSNDKVKNAIYKALDALDVCKCYASGSRGEDIADEAIQELRAALEADANEDLDPFGRDVNWECP